MSITRRLFCSSLAAAPFAATHPLDARQRVATARRVIEWSFESGKPYDDPFTDVQLDVVFTGPHGGEHRVPAYWAGDQTWRVRFAPPEPGGYTYRSVCSDAANPDLHGVTGELEVGAYEGSNALYAQGPLRVSESRRHFEHADGTPFFWLGDTWWMGLAKRLRWPEDFQRLAADRLRKGFNVIQIVAGLYPDMPPFDERSANEAGFAWEADFARIHPAYFDMADLRIQYLVEEGLLPCIVGCWGYYLPVLGIEKIKLHWRYLVARWGAYPVLWCLAGEGSMPYYLSENKEADRKLQEDGWSEVGRYLHDLDPYGRPITIHPSESSRETVSDPSVLDFDFLQTGHGDDESIPRTVEQVLESYAAQPVIPVINSEVCYEGILGACRQDIQRFMFWSCILSGACGHTYGANGIWQINTEGKPYGPSPHGRTWGNTPWDVAAQYPGSEQLGRSAQFLRRYPWWRMTPHQEWVEPHANPENYELPYAAGIPGELRIFYVPHMWNPPKLVGIEAGVTYKVLLFDPMTGEEEDFGEVPSDATEWQMELLPVQHDWVVVLEKA